MRWLLDQGLPRGAAGLLNEAAQNALHVGNIGMAEAPDSSILRHAVKEDRLIVTLDADFHALLALSAASRPSGIRIREEGLKGPALATLLLRIASQFTTELESGCMMTFHGGKIRLRALPLA